MYGCRPKSTSAGLGCGLGCTPAVRDAQSCCSCSTWHTFFAELFKTWKGGVVFWDTMHKSAIIVFNHFIRRRPSSLLQLSAEEAGKVFIAPASPDINVASRQKKKHQHITRNAIKSTDTSSVRETRQRRPLTGVLDVEQHSNEDVVDEVEADSVGKDRVPQHQQILHRKLAAKQKANPPTGAHK